MKGPGMLRSRKHPGVFYKDSWRSARDAGPVESFASLAARSSLCALRALCG